MTVARVFVDANVIYSRTLRDWLMHARVVTAGNMFTLVTSEDVLNETLARLRDDNATWDGAQISNIRNRVHHVFDEVVEDFPGDVEFPGKDSGDSHVHAAAISVQATMLLCRDRGFFECSDSLPYEPITPDDFFVLLDDAASSPVPEMVKSQLLYWSSRGQIVKLDEKLIHAGCPGFAERVAFRTAELAGPQAVRKFQAMRASGAT